MGKVSDVYKSGSSLKAEDLPAGRDVPVTIEAVRLVDFDEGSKLVLSFAGKEKTLVLNWTNATQVADVLGTDQYDNWPSASIVLYTTKVNYQGKMVPAIRVRDSVPNQARWAAQPAPQPRRPAPPPEPPPPLDTPLDDSDIPFAWLLPLLLPLTAATMLASSWT